MNVLCLCLCGTSALLLFGHKESLLNNLFHIFFGSTTNYNRQCFQLLANWYDTVQITTIHFRGMCTPAGQWIYFIQQIRNTTRDSPSMLHTLVCVCVVCEWAVVNACVTKATSLFFFCFNFIRFWIVVVASVIYIYIYIVECNDELDRRCTNWTFLCRWQRFAYDLNVKWTNILCGFWSIVLPR